MNIMIKIKESVVIKVVEATLLETNSILNSISEIVNKNGNHLSFESYIISKGSEL